MEHRHGSAARARERLGEPRSPCSKAAARSHDAAPDRFGGREPGDAERRVAGRQRPQREREDEGEGEQPRREEEELLPVAEHARVHRGADGQRQQHAGHPAPEAHADPLAQHLAEEIEVRGAQRALDAEVPNALEDGRRHRVRQRQASDEKPEGADPEQERGEEGGRLAQEAAQLAREW